MSATPSKEDPRIRAALEESLQRGEHGIAVAAYHRGKLIVDAFAGIANPTTKQAVDQETIFPIFSVTKGITALAVHLQAERGLLEVDAPIARYWPEFGVNGKETITITHALSHRSGIPQMPKDVTPKLLADWDWMVAQIQGHTPLFPTGTTNAYHVLVWGWILGEVVRRTDPGKRSFDVFVQEEICAPLGVKYFYLGVPDTELGRVAVLSGGNSGPLVDEYGISPKEVYPGSDVHNQRVMLQAVDPGAGAVATAGSVARIFALLAEGGQLDGVQFLSKERIKTFTAPREDAHAPDKVISIPTWIGASGYYLGGEPGASPPFVGSHRDVIYSPGAGGSYAWADLRNRIAVSICHNNMDTCMIVEPEMTFAPIFRALDAMIKDIEKEGDVED
jgi:CubicO group peptidase (beta-lactamase class C family)